MPFSVSIKINHREVVKIDGRNCGPPTGDRESCATRIYSYVAECPEVGGKSVGEILHLRDEGIERLVALILLDLAAKPRRGGGAPGGVSRDGLLPRYIGGCYDEE